MRGLSLTQPWAQLVAIGAKTIETRSWSTGYRGPIAIHAAKRFPREDRELCDGEPFRGALIAGGYDLGRSAYRTSPGGWAKVLPLGAIVAVARLVDVRPTHFFLTGIGPREYFFGNYDPGRFGFLLADVHPLPEPIPFSGSLGLWQVPAHVQTAIKTMCGGVR